MKKSKTIRIDDRSMDIKLKEYEQKHGKVKPLTETEKKQYGIIK